MSSYEEYVCDLLNKAHLSFTREKTFHDLKHGAFRYDFQLADGRLIEVDGEYHFKPIRGRRALLKQQEHDRQKNSYCLARDINLYRIPYWELSHIKNATDLFNPRFRVTNKWWNDKIWKDHLKKL